MSTSLPKEMRAARLLERKLEYTMQTIPLPIPGDRELLLKVHAAGFCHTDAVMPIHPEHGGPLPITGSHEPAGVLVAMGKEAMTIDKFKIGDRIMAVNTARACKTCPECKRFDERWCPNAAMIGLRFMDGAFAEYCLVDIDHAAVIPEGMSFEQAATFSCAGVTIYQSIMKSGVEPGGVLAISGLGALGLVGVQMAKAMGIKVVGIDAREGPCEAAASVHYTPDLVVNATETTPEEVVKQIDKLREASWDMGSGADAVIMANGAPAALSFGLSILRPHGLLVLTSGPPNVSIPILDFVWRDIVAVGTQNGTTANLEAAAKLCVERGIKSKVRLFDFTDKGMANLLHEVHAPEWSGKAVVKIA